MEHLNNILVGVDFSNTSDHALLAARRFAAWSDAKLTAIHALPEGISDTLHEHFSLSDEKVTAEALGWIETRLEAVLGADHTAFAELATGHAFDVLIDAVADRGSDLLVLGATGAAEKDDRRTVGLTATRCLQKAPVDVLLVRAPQRDTYRKIVSCIDFSQTSKKAARRAIEIAKHEGGQLEFLHVYMPVASYLTANIGYLSTIVPSAPVHLKDLDPDKIREHVDEFVRPLVDEAGGYDFEIVIEQSIDARSAIAEHLVSANADLVVLGTRGDSRLRNFLLGTTAENVLRFAPCSALAVKPD